MSETRYRAYLSYSHADQRWAKWLHRALEGYRVPGHIQDAAGETAPRRLSPIFRDRDDLSSASDLTGKLREALEQSEHLIVICSPAAAASRWVNEEIAYFRSLGREEQILCMVVDGDPQASLDEGGCFPPALFDGVQDSGSEPLAADPRDYADGKRLAMLKLVAGLLGVRLDALRRRDLSRQRRVKFAFALAAVAVIALLAVTVTSQMAEERERARAEQMATFIVDLGDELGEELDLEALGRMSSTAMRYLDNLDPEQLSPETRLKVGLALRQLGEVNLYQGKYPESEEAYLRSHDVFLALNDEYPENDDAVFELSQSEFWVGEYYRTRGDLDRTRGHWQNYLAIAREQHELKPDDPVWLLELSYATSNLVNFRIASNEPLNQEVLDALQENIALAGQALEAWDGDTEVMVHYSNELAFTADAQLQTCQPEKAEQTRRAALSIAQRIVEQEPGNRALELDLAWRHAGYGQLLFALGDPVSSLEHVERARLIMDSLLARDPSSIQLQGELAHNNRFIGRNLRVLGRFEEAQALLDDARPMLETLAFGDHATPWERSAYLLALEEAARLALARGDEGAKGLLETHAAAMARFSQDDQDYAPESERTVTFRYLSWQLSGEDPAQQRPELLENAPESTDPFRSCDLADLSAQHAALQGDQALLQTQVDYLEAAAYRDPDFIRFCRDWSVCTEFIDD